MTPLTLDHFAIVDGKYILSPDDKLIGCQELSYRAIFLSLDLDNLIRYDPNALDYIYRQVSMNYLSN